VVPVPESSTEVVLLVASFLASALRLVRVSTFAQALVCVPASTAIQAPIHLQEISPEVNQHKTRSYYHD
jgi:hypothetical protein